MVAAATLFLYFIKFLFPAIATCRGGRGGRGEVGTLWYLGVGILTHKQSPSSIQHTIKRRYPSIAFVEQVTKVKKCICKLCKKQIWCYAFFFCKKRNFLGSQFPNNMVLKFLFSTLCLGDPVGNAKGSFILLDGKTFEPKVNFIFNFYNMSSVTASMEELHVTGI